MNPANQFASLFGIATLLMAICGASSLHSQPFDPPSFRITEDDRAIKIETDKLEAVITKKNPKQWMTDIGKGSCRDKATGFGDIGDGLMVIDWLMEPGSDAGWDEKVFVKDGNGVSRYSWYENEADPARRHYTLMSHGSSHRKRMVEGPQLCHRMKPVQPEIIRGKDFVARSEERRVGKEGGARGREY